MKLSKYFMMIIMAFPILAHADFKSPQELVEKLNEAGAGQVFSINNPDLGSLFVTVDGDSTISLQNYIVKNGSNRLNDFDIVPNSFLKRDLVAYEVANKFICYKKQGAIERTAASTRYQFCIISTSSVDSMVKSISPSPKDITLFQDSTNAQQ